MRHSVCSRESQPDRRAHRLQRRAGTALRDQRRRHGSRARRCRAPRIEALAMRPGQSDSFDLEGRTAASWRAFVRGAAAELQRAGISRCAAPSLEISGNVPAGRRLSSSAALEVALSLALIALAMPSDPTARCSRSSARGSKTTGSAPTPACSTSSPRCSASATGRCGSTSARSRSSRSRSSSTATGSSRSTPASATPTRPRATTSVAPSARRRAGRWGSTSLRDATLEMAETLPGAVGRAGSACDDARTSGSSRPSRRCNTAIWRGSGQLLDASHASLRDCYEISTPAVEATVQRLRGAGAIGARIVGGGFGGNVLGLLPARGRGPRGRDRGPARIWRASARHLDRAWH